MRQSTILIVDEREKVAEMLALGLGERGYPLLTALNWKDARKITQKKHVDIVVVGVTPAIVNQASHDNAVQFVKWVMHRVPTNNIIDFIMWLFGKRIRAIVISTANIATVQQETGATKGLEEPVGWMAIDQVIKEL